MNAAELTQKNEGWRLIILAKLKQTSYLTGALSVENGYTKAGVGWYHKEIQRREL